MNSKNIKIPFTKSHGLGNDFIIFESLDLPRSWKGGVPVSVAKRLGDRHFGIGCDQFLILSDVGSDRVLMRIVDSDGTECELCGNGLRAAALYLQMNGLRSGTKKRVMKGRKTYLIQTLSGVNELRFKTGGLIEVALPGPRFPFGHEPESVRVGKSIYSITDVDLGNPHAVVWVKDVDAIDLAQVGPMLENHSRYPHRTNVHFVEVLSTGALKVRIWERGAGITLACGSGACAVGSAALARGLIQGKQARVFMPGGELRVKFQLARPEVIELIGPAEEVAQGSVWVK